MKVIIFPSIGNHLDKSLTLLTITVEIKQLSDGIKYFFLKEKWSVCFNSLSFEKDDWNTQMKETSPFGKDASEFEVMLLVVRLPSDIWLIRNRFWCLWVMELVDSDHGWWSLFPYTLSCFYFGPYSSIPGSFKENKPSRGQKSKSCSLRLEK